MEEEKKLKLYVFLIKNNLGQTNSVFCVAYNLEDATIDVNAQHAGMFVQPCGSIEWDNFVQQVNEKFKTVINSKYFEQKAKNVFKTNENNKQKSVYLLQYMKEQHGDCKLSTIIKKLDS